MVTRNEKEMNLVGFDATNGQKLIIALFFAVNIDNMNVECST